MKRWLLVSVVVSTVIVGAFLWSSWGERYTVVLTQDQLIEKLQEKFPIRKTILFVVGLTLTNPVLTLEDGSDRINFGCDVETELKGNSGKDDVSGLVRGSAKLSGKIRYEAEKGTFFLDESRIEALEVASIPDKWRQKVRDGASKAATELLNRVPVYTLRPTDVKKAAAKLVLRDVTVKEGKLVLTLGVG